MISKDKQYRTRDNREVRIYATDGEGGRRVHGAFLSKCGWFSHDWYEDGKDRRNCYDDPLDLFEVKPRIKRTVWLNVYHAPVGYHAGCYGSKDEADMYVSRSHQRIACVKVEIDVEEGEGL